LSPSTNAAAFDRCRAAVIDKTGDAAPLVKASDRAAGAAEHGIVRGNGSTVMGSSTAIEDDVAFLQAEARELAALAEECAGRGARRHLRASVLHTLAVELSVLSALGDDSRMDWLATEATRLLADQGKQDALSAFRATLSRLRPVPMLRPAG
jgi:hypothetical protein